MTRFFAFGCSYTHYSWPTWADLLGLSFDIFENWAIPGLGNQAIFERLVEAHARNNFVKDDLIIVQWSTHLRHDWFNRYCLKDRTSNWKTDGSIFSQRNEDIFDKKWQYLFFDEMAYIMHTLNFVSAAQNLLENIGCQWYMTSIGDLRNLGFDIITNSEHQETVDHQCVLKEKFPELEIYEKSLWSDRLHRWLTPMQPFCRSLKKDFYQFLDDKKRRQIDYHPIPRFHKQWLDSELTDKLQFKMDIDAQDLIVNSVDKIYEEVGKNKHRNHFDDAMQNAMFEKPEEMIYPQKYKGIY